MPKVIFVEVFVIIKKCVLFTIYYFNQKIPVCARLPPPKFPKKIENLGKNVRLGWTNIPPLDFFQPKIKIWEKESGRLYLQRDPKNLSLLPQIFRGPEPAVVCSHASTTRRKIRRHYGPRALVTVPDPDRGLRRGGQCGAPAAFQLLEGDFRPETFRRPRESPAPGRRIRPGRGICEETL